MAAPIYIDFDDVLCETARALLHIIKAEFGKTTAFEDIFSFDLTASFDLDEAQTDRLFDLFHDEDVLAGFAPVPGSAEAVRQWHALGAEIHIVTGRPPATHVASVDWLAAHDVPYHQITFVDKYGRNHDRVDAVEMLTLDELRQRKYSLAIDDSPSTLRFMAEHTDIPIVIMDRPWNVTLGTLGDDSRIMRCATWADVLERVPNPNII